MNLFCIDLQTQQVVPVDFALSRKSATEITVTWSDASATESGFRLQRSTASNFSSIDLDVTPAANSSVYQDTGLTNGTTYYYRIRTEDSDSAKHSAYVSKSVVAGPAHRIFVTSTTYDGNLNALGGAGALGNADAACAARPSADSLGGTWKAILSTSTSNASARISYTANAWVYDLRPANAGGPQLLSQAVNGAAFWSGGVSKPIQYDQSGTLRSNANIMTGSTAAGIHATGNSCLNFTSSDWEDYVQHGYNETGTTQWLNYSSDSCGSSYRLYCIDGQ